MKKSRKILALILSAAMTLSMVVPAFAAPATPVNGVGQVIEYEDFSDLVKVTLPTNKILSFQLDPIGLSALDEKEFDVNGERTVTSEEMAAKAGSVLFNDAALPVILNESTYGVKVAASMKLADLDKDDAAVTNVTFVDTVEEVKFDMTDPDNPDPSDDNNFIIALTASEEATSTPMVDPADFTSGGKQVILGTTAAASEFVFEPALYEITEKDNAGTITTTRKLVDGTGDGVALKFEALCNPSADWRAYFGASGAKAELFYGDLVTVALAQPVGADALVVDMGGAADIKLERVADDEADPLTALQYNDATSLLAALNGATAASDPTDPSTFAAGDYVWSLSGETGVTANSLAAFLLDDTVNASATVPGNITGVDKTIVVRQISKAGEAVVTGMETADDANRIELQTTFTITKLADTDVNETYGTDGFIDGVHGLLATEVLPVAPATSNEVWKDYVEIAFEEGEGGGSVPEVTAATTVAAATPATVTVDRSDFASNTGGSYFTVKLKDVARSASLAPYRGTVGAMAAGDFEFSKAPGDIGDAPEDITLTIKRIAATGTTEQFVVKNSGGNVNYVINVTYQNAHPAP